MMISNISYQNSTAEIPSLSATGFQKKAAHSTDIWRNTYHHADDKALSEFGTGVYHF
jgi:hypothetical protein